MKIKFEGIANFKRPVLISITLSMKRESITEEKEFIFTKKVTLEY